MEKKINYISYLVELSKRQKNKETIAELEDKEIKQQSATLSLSFLAVRLDGLEGKREDVDRINSTNKLYKEKRERLNVRVDFQTFFIKKMKEAKSRKKNRSSSFDIKLYYFHFFYYLSSFLEYQCLLP